MAQHRAVGMRNFRRVRSAMNLRLAKAKKEGRLHEVMAEIEREGKRLYSEIVNGHGNGRKSHVKR